MGENDDVDAGIAKTRADEPHFLGLTEAGAVALAERLGLELRVLRSPDAVMTMDYRTRRMTVDVSTGSVTRAFAG